MLWLLGKETCGGRSRFRQTCTSRGIVQYDFGFHGRVFRPADRCPRGRTSREQEKRVWAILVIPIVVLSLQMVPVNDITENLHPPAFRPIGFNSVAMAKGPVGTGNSSSAKTEEVTS